MKLALVTHGTTLCLPASSVVLSTEGQSAVYRIKLPSHDGPETIVMELSPQELQGALDLVGIVARDNDGATAGDALGRIGRELVRELEARGR